MTATNGVAAANAMIDRQRDRQRVRQLVRQIAANMPRFRRALCVLRRDLSELAKLSGTDAADVLIRLDCLDQDIKNLLYYASGGEHDAHEPAASLPGAANNDRGPQ